MTKLATLAALTNFIFLTQFFELHPSNFGGSITTIICAYRNVKTSFFPLLVPFHIFKILQVLKTPPPLQSSQIEHPNSNRIKKNFIRLLRKGQKDPTLNGNYRPISLLSIHYKLAQCCITQRLQQGHIVFCSKRSHWHRAPKTSRLYLLLQYFFHFSHASSYFFTIFFENC